MTMSFTSKKKQKKAAKSLRQSKIKGLKLPEEAKSCAILSDISRTDYRMDPLEKSANRQSCINRFQEVVDILTHYTIHQQKAKDSCPHVVNFSKHVEVVIANNFVDSCVKE